MARSMNRLVGTLAWLAAAVACNRGPDASQATKTLAPVITTTTKTVREDAAPARTSVPADENAAPSVRPAAIPPAAVPASGAAPTAKGISATVGKAKLVLRGCQLEVAWAGAAPTTTDADLPEPCLFVTTRSGAAQVVKTDHGQALLVVSSRRDASSEKDCDTKIRAVVVKGDRVAVSREKQEEKQEIATCGTDGPFDTLLFHTLAESAS